MNLEGEIKRLKKEMGVVILAHFYTTAEVQDIADFVGDSLALSQQAAQTDAEVILFAGVKFMAETAKVLSPEKKILLPEMSAGCSLADSCGAREFAAFKAKHPDHTVISYVNTSVEVKALTDICCTSSNVLKIIGSLPKEQKIIFAPDRNLGAYVKRCTGRDDIVLWDGACHVHERFLVEHVLTRRKYPNAKVVAHPECTEDVLCVADFVGSTSAILDFCGKDESNEFIVITECGIMYELNKRYPQKKFYLVPIEGKDCNECEEMKKVTLEKIYDCLLNQAPEIVIDEKIRVEAEGSIKRMLELSV